MSASPWYLLIITAALFGSIALREALIQSMRKHGVKWCRRHRRPNCECRR